MFQYLSDIFAQEYIFNMYVHYRDHFNNKAVVESSSNFKTEPDLVFALCQKDPTFNAIIPIQTMGNFRKHRKRFSHC